VRARAMLCTNALHVACRVVFTASRESKGLMIGIYPALS
jgi:hypothetical protein